jgi:hypothetical protein
MLSVLVLMMLLLPLLLSAMALCRRHVPHHR